jgi:anti-sigma B factor antagonist
MIEILKEQESTCIILHLKGEIDASSSIELDDEIGRAIREFPSLHLFIDCEGLDYISSAGLGVFIAYLKTMDENHTRMIIYGLNDKVKNVFEILGLDQIITLAADKEEAKKHIQ